MRLTKKTLNKEKQLRVPLTGAIKIDRKLAKK
jgi:hypothetical protein